MCQSRGNSISLHSVVNMMAFLLSCFPFSSLLVFGFLPSSLFSSLLFLFFPVSLAASLSLVAMERGKPSSLGCFLLLIVDGFVLRLVHGVSFHFGFMILLFWYACTLLCVWPVSESVWQLVLTFECFHIVVHFCMCSDASLVMGVVAARKKTEVRICAGELFVHAPVMLMVSLCVREGEECVWPHF